MREMAKDMNMSEKTMRNIVKNDLGPTLLKMQTRHQLTDLQKEKRLAREKILLNKFKDDTGANEIVFTDKKLFTVEASSTVRINEFWQSHLRILRVPPELFSDVKNPPRLWCGVESP